MGMGLFGVAAAGAGLYGIGLGVAAPVASPRSLSEAEEQSTWGSLGVNILRDMAIAGADDALIFATLPVISRVAPKWAGLAKSIGLVGGVIGTGIAGGIFGHDVHRFNTARTYIGEHQEELARSQALVPDRRINPINGFQSGGPGAAQRTDKTGIASPAAGGILYRMTHNPFADVINSNLGGTPPTEDPRPRALTLSYFGGLLGTAVGLASKGGLARASAMGVLGGVAGGGYGIYTAHNPDMDRNIQAIGDVALGAMPIMSAAGLIYGARRIPKLGPQVDRFLDYASNRFFAGGEAATNASLWLKDKQLSMEMKVGQAGIALQKSVLNSRAYSNVDTMSFAMHEGTKDWPVSAPHIPALKLQQAIGDSDFGEMMWKPVGATMEFARGTLGEFVAPTLLASATEKGRWNQSLAVGHILTTVPHQALVVAEGVNLVQNNRRKSKATNTMPSNRRAA